MRALLKATPSAAAGASFGPRRTARNGSRTEAANFRATGGRQRQRLLLALESPSGNWAGWQPQPGTRQRLARPQAAAAAVDAGASALDTRPLAGEAMFSAACVAVFLAAVHRVAFSVLAVPLQQQLGFTTAQMGTLHAALLLGYLLGQVRPGWVLARLLWWLLPRLLWWLLPGYSC